MMRSGSLSIHVLFEPEKVLAEERLSRRWMHWIVLDGAERGQRCPMEFWATLEFTGQCGGSEQLPLAVTRR